MDILRFNIRLSSADQLVREINVYWYNTNKINIDRGKLNTIKLTIIEYKQGSVKSVYETKFL